MLFFVDQLNSFEAIHEFRTSKVHFRDRYVCLPRFSKFEPITSQSPSGCLNEEVEVHLPYLRE